MTNNIQHIIDEISRKQSELYQKLVEERAKNQQFSVEIESLKHEIHSLNDKIAQKNDDFASLKLELEANKNKVVNVVVDSNEKNDQQIDELVKEIEFCISQLKDNE